jgi:hypothetical protein
MSYRTGMGFCNKPSEPRTGRLLDMSVTSVTKKRCVFSRARTHCWPSAGPPCAQPPRCCLWQNTRNYRSQQRGPRGLSSAIHPLHAIDVDPQVLPVLGAPSWWRWSGTPSMDNAGWCRAPLQHGQGQWHGCMETLETERCGIYDYIRGDNDDVAPCILMASSFGTCLPDCITWG